MNKKLVKLLIPFFALGALAGCTPTESLDVDGILTNSFKTALINMTSGEWINDDYYDWRLEEPANLVVYTQVEVIDKKTGKTYDVEMAYNKAEKLAEGWEEYPMSLKKDDYRRKLVVKYTDGETVNSSIKLTASYKGKSKEITYRLQLISPAYEQYTLSEVNHAVPKVGDMIKTKGKILYKFANTARDGIAIADGDAALLIYDKNKNFDGSYGNYKVGDVIEVCGQLDKYSGLYELYPNKMTVLTGDTGVANPVTLDANIDLWKDTDTMLHSTSRLVNFENLKVTKSFKDGVAAATASAAGTGTILAVDPSDETKTLEIKFTINYHIGDATIKAIQAKVATLNEGDFINVRGALLSAYNDLPQLSFIDANNISLLK